MEHIVLRVMDLALEVPVYRQAQCCGDEVPTNKQHFCKVLLPQLWASIEAAQMYLSGRQVPELPLDVKSFLNALTHLKKLKHVRDLQKEVALQSDVIMYLSFAILDKKPDRHPDHYVPQSFQQSDIFAALDILEQVIKSVDDQDSSPTLLHNLSWLRGKVRHWPTALERTPTERQVSTGIVSSSVTR